MRIGRFGFALGQGVLFAGAYWHEAVSAHVFHRASPEAGFICTALCCIFGSWVLAVLRCHDFNETVWDNFWKEQTPFVGQIWALGELLIPGTPGRNSFGAQPLLCSRRLAMKACALYSNR